MNNKETTFNNKCKILAELWMDFRDVKEFQDFVSYNDLSLPIAFAIDQDLVKPGNGIKAFIDETFDLLLTSLEIEDQGYKELDEMLGGFDLD